MDKSLVIGELDNPKFEKNEKIIVIENYYKDFYINKNIKQYFDSKTISWIVKRKKKLHLKNVRKYIKIF